MRLDRVCRIAVAGLSVLLLVCYFVRPFGDLADETISALVRSLLLHLIGTAIFCFVLLYLRAKVWAKPSRPALLVLFPAFVIALNNFPWIGLLSGSVRVDRPEWIWLLALDALFIGAFEELAFRGALLPILLKRFGRTKKGFLWTVILSSAIFGLFHLLNLLEGAGIGATLLQVGYSFLIGGMCAIVYLKTGDLIACILIHGVYDLGGSLVPMLGSGELWDLPTVILTVLLSVIVTAWMLYLLIRMTRFRKEEKEEFHVGRGNQDQT